MRVYKVVRKKEDKFVSYFANGPMQVGYKLGEISKPPLPNNPLFAFYLLDDAKDYISFNNYFYDPDYRILECEAELYVATLSVMLDSNFVDLPDDEPITGLSIITKFWKDPANKHWDTLREALPAGTVLCKWVKPIKEVMLECG